MGGSASSPPFMSETPPSAAAVLSMWGLALSTSSPEGAPPPYLSVTPKAAVVLSFWGLSLLTFSSADERWSCSPEERWWSPEKISPEERPSSLGVPLEVFTSVSANSLALSA
jgi:hypothetical protein